MAVLSEANRRQLTGMFEEGLTNDVQVVLYTQRESPIIIPGRECPSCRPTGELLQEVTSLSEKLHLEVHDFHSEREDAARLGIHRIPAFLLKGQARGRVRFFGIPAGFEFQTLIDGLIDVSRGSTSLSEGSRTALMALTDDVHIQVFTTPT